MRILLITPHFAPALIEGGGTISIWNLARGLALAGADVRVVTTDAYTEGQGAVEPERVEAGLRIRTLPVLGALGAAAQRYGIAPAMSAAIRDASREVDLCLLQGLWAFPAAVGSKIIQRRLLPYVLCAQGTLEEISLGEKATKKRLHLALLGNRLIRRAAAVHFVSERERQNSATALGTTRAIVVHHGFDAVERQPRDRAGLRRRLGLPDDSVILGMSGRLHPRKGFEVILPALAQGSSRTHLVAFGPDLEDNFDAFRKLAADHGVENRFHYLGFLRGEDLQSTYASIDLLVLPSFGESLGNAVVDALLQGTEVMLSDRVALADYVAKESLGRIVPGQDPVEWARALGEWTAGGGRFDRDRACRIVRRDFDLRTCGVRAFRQLDQLRTP